MSAPDVGPGATLAQLETALRLRGAVLVSLVWSESLLEYACRLRCRRSGGLAYGTGRTIADALRDALDEMTAVVRGRRRASAR